jgi:receptor expression-enhancing protein 5/6
MADWKEKVLVEVQKLMTVLDEKLQNQKLICNIAEKAQCRRSHVAVGITALAILLIGFGVGSGALSSAIGFAYPVYASFQALKSEDKEDDTQWLTYWVVYGCFVLVESFTTILTAWIPMFFLWKILFLTWCFLPQTRGAMTVYHKIIEPLLNKYESQIDAKLAAATKGVLGVAEDVQADVQNAAQQAVLQAAVEHYGGKKLQ